MTAIHRSAPPYFVSTLPHSYQPLVLPQSPSGALLGRRTSLFHPQHTGAHPQILPSPLSPSLTSVHAAAVVVLRSSAKERFVKGLHGWARRHFNPSRYDESPTFFLFFGLTPLLHTFFDILESAPFVSIIFALLRRESIYTAPPSILYHSLLYFFLSIRAVSRR